MNGLIHAATDWLKSTDGERRLKDVHDEFLTKDFCRNLTSEQAKQLFTAAMYNYVVLGGRNGTTAHAAG